MTQSDYNALPGEKHRGPMNELVAIRDEVIENAWLKAQAGAMAMDLRAVEEIDMHPQVDDHSRLAEAALASSLQAPVMPEMPVEPDMLHEADGQDPGYIDQMAAEARVEQSYADAEARSSYELAA